MSVDIRAGYEFCSYLTINNKERLVTQSNVLMDGTKQIWHTHETAGHFSVSVETAFGMMYLLRDL